MFSISCCLKINDRFASGIIFNPQRGLILTIISDSREQIHVSDCTVWIQLGSRQKHSIIEFEADVLNHSALPHSNEVINTLKPILYLVGLKKSTLLQDDYLLEEHTKLICSPIYQGDSVLVVGSPFGPACPPVLLNNHFKGIVSKTCGYKVSMLLIDIFCPKGLTGAPVFIIKNNEILLYGLLLTDSNYFNEYSSDIDFGTIFPVISITAILPQLRNLDMLMIRAFDLILSLTRYVPIVNPIEFSPNPSLIPASILSRIVRVQARSTCGTGIMVTDYVCITCAHVVADVCLKDLVKISSINSKNVPVYFHLSFTSKPNLYPDIAFLVKPKVDFADLDPNVFNDMDGSKHIMSEGNEILGISYEYTKYSEDLSSPLVTSGCVSHIVRNDGDIVFAQTTCSLNEGGSGGLVVDQRSLNFMGIFFGYAKVEFNTVTHFYPQISRFIPLQVIWSIWKQGLEESCNTLERNTYIQNLWNYAYPITIPNSTL